MIAMSERVLIWMLGFGAAFQVLPAIHYALHGSWSLVPDKVTIFALAVCLIVEIRGGRR